MNDRRYFQSNAITIINDDLLATELVPEGGIDLTVTSPPYNVGESGKRLGHPAPFPLELARRMLEMHE